MRASVIGSWLPRRTVAWLLTVPSAVLYLFRSFQPPFISGADPENYYSHAVAWMFVSVMCALSFVRSELWKPGEQRTSVVMVRGSIAICAAAVVLDVVGDVLVPVFVLKAPVANAVAWPLFIAMPVSLVAAVAAVVVARRPKGHQPP